MFSLMILESSAGRQIKPSRYSGIRIILDICYYVCKITGLLDISVMFVIGTAVLSQFCLVILQLAVVAGDANNDGNNMTIKKTDYHNI